MKHIELSKTPILDVSHNPAIKKQVMLNPGDIPNLVFFSQSCFKPGHVAPGHSHRDMSEVFFVESGQGTIVVDGTSHPLAPGTCVAVKPGENHEIRNTGTDNLILTYFAIRTEDTTKTR